MEGKAQYSNATEILITADCGGSNGYRTKLWKVELQKLACTFDVRSISLKIMSDQISFYKKRIFLPKLPFLATQFALCSI